jgi:hypothetical protein
VHLQALACNVAAQKANLQASSMSFGRVRFPGAWIKIFVDALGLALLPAYPYPARPIQPL